MLVAASNTIKVITSIHRSMHFTTYPIKQINYIEFFPAEKQMLNKIISKASDPFRDNLPYDEFVKTDLTRYGCIEGIRGEVLRDRSVR